MLTNKCQFLRQIMNSPPFWSPRRKGQCAQPRSAHSPSAHVGPQQIGRAPPNFPNGVWSSFAALCSRCTWTTAAPRSRKQPPGPPCPPFWLCVKSSACSPNSRKRPPRLLSSNCWGRQFPFSIRISRPPWQRTSGTRWSLTFGTSCAPIGLRRHKPPRYGDDWASPNPLCLGGWGAPWQDRCPTANTQRGGEPLPAGRLASILPRLVDWRP